MNTVSRRIVPGLLALVLLLAAGVAVAEPDAGSLPGADAALPPDIPEDFVPYLTSENMAKIRAGEIVSVDDVEKGADGGTLAGGYVMAAIDRDPDAVWKILSNYTAYPEFMPSVVETRYYDDEGPAYGLAYKLKILLTEVRYHSVSVQEPERRQMIFHLDESKKNEIKASRGGWYVRPLEPGRSLILYRVHADPGSSLPPSIVQYLTKKTMPGAVKALKKRVESDGTYHK